MAANNTTQTGVYVTVSRDSDAWGSDVSQADAARFSSVIVDACELAGIDCYCDTRPCTANDDGSERWEIQWFPEWCTGGHAWDAKKWAEWLQSDRRLF